jgi:DNA replication licensing factor MCM2
VQLLARFVIGSHLRSHPKFEGEEEEMTIGDSLDQDVSLFLLQLSATSTKPINQLIPQDMLRKYLMYARERVQPKLHDLDREKLARLFADLRRESLATGSFPITVRHLESMIRYAILLMLNIRPSTNCILTEWQKRVLRCICASMCVWMTSIWLFRSQLVAS